MKAGEGKRVRVKRGRISVYVSAPCWINIPPDMDLNSAYLDVIIDGEGEITYVHMDAKSERRKPR